MDRGQTMTVRWLDAGVQRDAAAGERWCALVGPPAMKVAAPRAGGAVDSIAIVSWNTHVGAGDLIGLVEDLRAGRWTGGEPVEHFILLLQEVFRAGELVPSGAGLGAAPRRIAPSAAGGERLDVTDVADRLKLELFYVPSMRNGREDGAAAEDRGNAILSTLPLSEHTAVELPFEAQRRVAIAAAVTGVTSDGAGWQLHLTNVHLDTRSRLERLHASFGAGRLRQTQGLLRNIPQDRPAVLGGDLNTWSLGPLEGTLPLLRREFPDTPAEQDRPTYHLLTGLAWRLDHLFFRLPEAYEARVERLDSRYGSDHYPLLGWVRFETLPAADIANSRHLAPTP